MTEEKTREVLDWYIELLDRLGYIPTRFDEDVLTHSLPREKIMEHILWMCHETTQLLDGGKLEKVYRWLGFIQGALWSEGIYSIPSLKSHNR